MKEIIELNKRLIEMAGKSSSENVLFLERNDNLSEETRLPSALQAGIEELRGKLNQIVPNDFGYCLALGDEFPSFMIEYQDGPQSMFSRGHEWDPDQSIVEQLKDFDWASERANAMASGQMMDTMKEDAKHLPSRLPSTKELQKEFRAEMKEFLKAKRQASHGVDVLMWCDDEGMKEECFDSRESFSGELPNIMTVQLLVIAIVADGKPLSRDEIENLKKNAVAELEDMPISHAKALCKL